MIPFDSDTGSYVALVIFKLLWLEKPRGHKGLMVLCNSTGCSVTADVDQIPVYQTRMLERVWFSSQAPTARCQSQKPAFEDDERGTDTKKIGSHINLLWDVHLGNPSSRFRLCSLPTAKDGSSYCNLTSKLQDDNREIHRPLLTRSNAIECFYTFRLSDV